MLSNIRHTLSYSFRMLVKYPAFTITAVLTIALGIGATTSIFSVVYATLFEPLPYPKSEQLMVLWSRSGNEGRGSVSPGDYLDWKKRNTTFQDLRAWTGDGAFNLAAADRPE